MTALASFLMVLLPLVAAGQWWWLRRQWLARLRVAKLRHIRDNEAAAEALAGARRQIDSLQHQLAGARLKGLRDQRPSTTPARAPLADRSPLLMIGEPRPWSGASGFEETVFGA